MKVFQVLIFFSVGLFLCGALSLVVVTLNRVLGIVFPKGANLFKFNRKAVYCVMVLIWILSFGTAYHSTKFKSYYVSFKSNLQWLCLLISSLLTFFRQMCFSMRHLVHAKITYVRKSYYLLFFFSRTFFFQWPLKLNISNTGSWSVESWFGFLPQLCSYLMS